MNGYIQLISLEQLPSTIDFVFESILKSGTSQTYMRDPIQGKQFFKEMTLESVQDNELVLYGYFKGNILLGVIGIENANYITFLYVKEEAQKTGIGTSLLQYVEQLCLSQNEQQLVASVHKNAILFYQKFGFVFDDNPNNQQESYRMHCDCKRKEVSHGISK